MRYFFDIASTRAYTKDSDGRALPDLASARRVALKTLGQVASEEILDFGAELSITVRDPDGTAVFRARLSLDTSD